jgi:DsbC/DsbD-like thiol-disulfide interchange protein
MKKIFFIALLLMITGNFVKAQILHPVTWSYAAKKINAKEAVVFLKATIEDGWHIYSQNVGDGGPVKTSFDFKTAKGYTVEGKTSEPKAVERFEKVFNMTVSYFEHEVVFQQKIKLKGNAPFNVSGTLHYMTCNDKQCLPPEDVDFNIPVK